MSEYYCRACFAPIDDEEFGCTPGCKFHDTEEDYTDWMERAMPKSEWLEVQKQTNDEWAQARKDGLIT